MDSQTPETTPGTPASPAGSPALAPGTPEVPSGPNQNPVQDVGPVARPKEPNGPNAPAIVLGVVAMVLGTLIIASETLTWHVDWSGLGPGGIVVIGLVLVVIGAIGLVRRHDDA